MPRLILCNLDCDLEFRGVRGGGLPGEVLRVISPLATLMRVFAEEGDWLWTPAPIDPWCVAEVDGLVRPVLLSGPFPAPGSLDALLPWAETRTVAAMRSRKRQTLQGVEPDLATRLWNFRPPRAEVVAEVNHKGYGLELSRSFGCALEGACLVSDPAEVERRLRDGGARASRLSRFVLKAPWSSSGRDRLVLGEDALRVPELRGRIERLFAAHSELIFEPWMERIADFGSVAFVDEEVRCVGLHSQEVDPRDGRFLGLALERGARPFSRLGAMERTMLEETTREVGARLQEKGYRGPFGLDAWRYRTRDGEPAFHPLGELNARLTMGFLGQQIVQRILERREEDFAGEVRLRIGKEPPEERGDETVTILVRRGEACPIGAWLEWRPDRRA